jgi:rhodanese-related sulfurtransferase
VTTATDLDGRVALVAGGTAGIGTATATRLAELGATVVLVGSTPERGEEAVAAVVDVLAAEDYEDEHIPGTSNIPYDEVEERFPEEFDESDDVIVYCLDESCQASPESAATLEEMGFENVRDYEEGLVGWKERGYEVTSAD